MALNDHQDPEKQTLPKIIQKASNYATQFGQVFGNVIINNNYGSLSSKQLLFLALFVFLVIIVFVLVLFKLVDNAIPKLVEPPATTSTCAQVDIIDPVEMTGGFNIAVANFTEADETGQMHPSDDGQRLSRLVFDQLEEAFESLCLATSVQIWHDSLEPNIKRAKIESVLGASPEERTEASAMLADKIKADLVIYGHLTLKGGDPTNFTPEFFVANQSEVEDIIGHHRLGEPIPVQSPVDRLSTKLQFTKLSARIKVLSLIIVGMAFESNREPAKALEFFQRAEQMEEWDDIEGRDILYLLIGREAHLLNRIDDAQNAYEKALELNPSYARAHLGLGNIHYNKAENLMKAYQGKILGLLSRPKLDKALNQAIAEHKLALDYASDSPRTLTQIKAHVALGGSYRLQGEAYKVRQEYKMADSLLDMAIEQFRSAISMANEEQVRQAGQAYLGMGIAYMLKADLQEEGIKHEELLKEALGAYEKCIELANANLSDWWLNYYKTDFCEPYKDETQQKFLTLQEGESK